MIKYTLLETYKKIVRKHFFMRSTAALSITRLPQHAARHYEIKDPSVVQVEDGTFMMYASVGNSKEQTWLVGRFVADTIDGQWTELEPVIFHDLSGPQLCAPAVMFEIKDDQPLWTMYIQTACFEEGGVIALATSPDGHHFYGQPQPLATRESTDASANPIIGVYDVGVSTITKGTEELLCMLYSGYRRVGCGDIYISTKGKNDQQWSQGQCLITQEDVPFHNRPDYEHFEWGLEGAKLVQFSDDCYLIIGVCFMPLPDGYLGTRQRVFFAVADKPEGPYKPIGMPFVPSQENNKGENGHPDLLIVDDKVVVIYQERAGDGQPWYLRSASFDMEQLHTFLEGKLNDSVQVTEQAHNYSLESFDSYHMQII
jgi:hypothetical protein